LYTLVLFAMVEENEEGINQASASICYTCSCMLTIPLAMVVVGRVTQEPPAAYCKMGQRALPGHKEKENCQLFVFKGADHPHPDNHHQVS
jgi:hypothetical protein